MPTTHERMNGRTYVVTTAVVIVAAVGVAAILWDVIAPFGPSPSPELRTKWKLEKVHFAINVYRSEHDGSLPPSLDSLVGEYAVLDVLVSPITGDRYAYRPDAPPGYPFVIDQYSANAWIGVTEDGTILEGTGTAMRGQ